VSLQVLRPVNQYMIQAIKFIMSCQNLNETKLFDMKYNPISKTYIKREKGKIQHYSSLKYQCNSCGNVFRPKIHSQSMILQFGAIIVGVVIFGILVLTMPEYIYIFIALLLCYAFYYLKKSRRVSSTDTGKPRYGDIILECTKCGSNNIAPGR